MMGRQSGAILILSALVAFFLPLVGRVLWQQYQQLISVPMSMTAIVSQSPSAGSTGPADRLGTTAAARARPTEPPVAGRDQGQVAVASYTPGPPGILPGYDARDSRGQLGRAIELPTDEAAAQVETAAAGTQTADPLRSFKSTLTKLGLVSVTLVLVCLACVRFGQPLKMGRHAARQLHVEDSIALSRDAGVKLICVDGQKFVVGHDRRGLQSLVLLPQRFDEVFRGELRDDATQTPVDANMADSIRSTLANPEDDGWDLNRRIS